MVKKNLSLTKTILYRIRLLNFDGPLPIEIKSKGTVQKLMINKEGIVLDSPSIREVDLTGYYIKKVILEY